MNGLPDTSSVTGMLLDRASAGARAAAGVAACSSFRPDIEGLRGVAVLSVLAVHSFPEWLKGGFIGVDIFFVLSGYLISTILWQSLEAGRFDLTDFYLRRARRIFPALCLVLFACMAFGIVFVFPGDLRQLGHHAAAGTLFISNVALWKETGYFDMASESKPLLHLWSLGIEEQFYLAWPLAMAWMYRRRRWATALIVAALALSFSLNVAFVASRPTATFFLPPTRVWELMIGTLLAIATLRGDGPVAWVQRRLPAASRWTPWVAAGFSLGGLWMLCAALLLIDRTDHFPGWWALLPTLGTAALLAAGPAAPVNRHVLSHPVLRFYGAISYPLYLWHWPLLCFPVVMHVPMTAELRVGILVGSVILAVLTCELIEKPLVRVAKVTAAHSNRVAWWLCGLLALAGICGVLLRQSHGLSFMYPPSLQAMAAAEFPSEPVHYRVGRCFLRTEETPSTFRGECVDRTPSSMPLLFLWGDSHAASLYPGLRALRRSDGNWLRLAQYTAATCPPLLQTPELASARCKEVNAMVLDRIAAERPATVVLGGHWSYYARDGAQAHEQTTSLRDTVAHLKALGVERVIVMGQLPVWTVPQPRVVLEQWRRTDVVSAHASERLDRGAFDADERVRQAVRGTGAAFVSPIENFCGVAGCRVAIDVHGVFMPVAFDVSHLTLEGSQWLIDRSRDVFLQ